MHSLPLLYIFSTFSELHLHFFSNFLLLLWWFFYNFCGPSLNLFSTFSLLFLYFFSTSSLPSVVIVVLPHRLLSFLFPLLIFLFSLPLLVYLSLSLSLPPSHFSSLAISPSSSHSSYPKLFPSLPLNARTFRLIKSVVSTESTISPHPPHTLSLKKIFKKKLRIFLYGYQPRYN